MDRPPADSEALRQKIRIPNAERCFAVAEGYRRRMTTPELHALSAIDPWFLDQIEELVALEKEVEHQGLDSIDKRVETALLNASPQWLTAIGAKPMYLGLDLRGGVHFLMQVDMKAALTKKAESLTGDVRTMLRDKNIRGSAVSRNGQTIEVVILEKRADRITVVLGAGVALALQREKFFVIAAQMRGAIENMGDESGLPQRIFVECGHLFNPTRSCGEAR